MTRVALTYGLTLALGLPLLGFLQGCAPSRELDQPDPLAESSVVVRESAEGVASYYANKFHGRKTASGERYDKRRMTAAHKTYPFGTWLRVTSLRSGASVIVRVNDRGPLRANRIVDLSRAAAEELGMIRAGLDRVRVEVLDWNARTGVERDE